MMTVSTFFKNYHEYIPVVSSVTSLHALFKACVLQQKDVFLKTHNFSSLKEKSALRTIVLIVPVVGNLTVALYDLKKYGEFLFTLKAVQASGLSLQYASEDNRNHKTIVEAAVKQKTESLQFASILLRNDEAFVEGLITQDITAFYFAGDEIRRNKSFVTKMIEKHGISLLKFVDAELQNDKLFILSMLKKTHLALKFAPELKKDKNFISEIVKLTPSNFRYADANLRKDRAFVKILMVEDIAVLEYAKDEVRADESFVTEQMLLNKEILKYTPLRNDKNFISKKLKTDLSILQFASDEIRNDKAFITQFKADRFKIYQYVSDALKNDLPFILECQKEHGLSLEHLSDAYRNNEDIILNCIQNKMIDDLKWMGSDFYQNYRFAEKAVAINGKALEFFHESILNNEKHLLIAVKTSCSPLDKLNDFMEINEEFFFKATAVNAEAIMYAHYELQMNHNFVIHAVVQNWKVLKYCQFKNDRAVVFGAITENILALKDVDDDLRDDEDFIVEVSHINTQFFEYASDNLRSSTRFILRFIERCGLHVDEVQNFVRCAHCSIWKDKEFIEEFIELGFNPLAFMSHEAYQNNELIKNILRVDIKLYELLCETRRNDPEIAQYISIKL